MPTPILATKLYLPPPRPNVVVRSRLIDKLNTGLRGKLTLVSAPAGFGKSTLVSAWATDCGQPIAWLSLDQADNDLSRFLTYLVVALQTLAPVGVGLIEGLQAGQPPPTEAILTGLLNQLVTLQDTCILVLDDYHVLESPPIDQALTFLLEHLPPQLRLIINTREDPQLPLARLRARGQLTELRAEDLRFTPAEAADFLNDAMGLSLSAPDIAVLETRTEGWITGLQLAALSLQGQPNIPAFIQAFAGDHRYIVDYLVEEVLERQPDSIRSFLLQTAILDRLNGPLCDAVTGQQGGSERLEALNRGNFFVVPLDNWRYWYRYHHLFADVLLAHLRTEQPDQVAALHRRASAWYAQNDLPFDAIRHALAGEDFERAAAFIERAVPAMTRSRQEPLLLTWLSALPQNIFDIRPVLNVYYAGTLLQNGQPDGVEARLQKAERWLDPLAPPADRVVEDEAMFPRLPGMIAMYRAGIALMMGDVANTLTYARRALELAGEDDALVRGAAASMLGLAYWTSGDLEAAYQSYSDGMAHLRLAGNISDIVGGTPTLADIRITQGRLREARQHYQRALELAADHGALTMRGTADIYVGLSELARERSDLDAATKHLLASQAQGEHTGFPQYAYRWRVAMARIRETEGDLDSALDLLREAERLYVSDFHPQLRPIAALKARVWIAQGRLGEALEWTREQRLTAADDLNLLREFDHITLARVLLAQSQRDHDGDLLGEAIGLLDRLRLAAEAGERTGSVIEILTLEALAFQMQGNLSTALTRLERALTLAEPEGYVRLFVDEGAPMAALLEKAAKQGIAPGYVRQLRAALGSIENTPPVQQTLVEPLSERELDVLRLLGTDLSGPEIANQLVVSLSTLRTHTQNIYTKLGVNNRRAAVRRAEELNLF